MRKSETFFTVLLLPVDFAMIVLSAFFAYWLRLSPMVAEYRPVLFNISPERYFFLASIIALIWLGIFSLSGLYKMKHRSGALEDFTKILVGTSAGLAIIVIYIFLKREWFDSRFLILGGWLFSVFMVVLGRSIVAQVQKLVVGKYGWGAHRVLVLGNNQVGEIICREIQVNKSYGMKIVGVLPIFDMPMVSAAAKKNKVDDIIMVSADFNRELVTHLIDYCHERRIGFRFVPNLFQTLTSNVSVDAVAAFPLIELRRTALDGWGSVLKRSIDIVGGLVGAVLLVPISFLTGIIIKLDSPGPIFVKLNRVGRGKTFGLLKYRSMIKDAETRKDTLWEMNERKDGPLFKIKNDPRVTKAGKFLRRYRLDELPQLWNVLKGEMSLVGPRPHQPDEIAKYEKRHKQLLVISPGITGMAQVSGSSDLSFEQEVRLDIFYIENWSLLLDLKILIKTFFVIFRDKSAC